LADFTQTQNININEEEWTRQVLHKFRCLCLIFILHTWILGYTFNKAMKC